ncbi:MAG: choice-of-anchor D domain-containing protein [Wenzhouxiangella sp.]
MLVKHSHHGLIAMLAGFFLLAMPSLDAQAADEKTSSTNGSTSQAPVEIGPGYPRAAPPRLSELRGNPDIVIVDDVNYPVSNTLDGSAINWVTGATCDCDDNPGYDFNPWNNNGNLSFWWWNGTGSRAGLSLDGLTYAVLDEGDTIGPDSTFISNGFAAAAANWRQSNDVDGFLGFRFLNDGVVNYGYVRLTTTGLTGFPATIVSYAYNQAGGPITIPSAVNTVTAEVGAGQGTINPASQEVDFGDDASFTVTPQTGWSVDSVVGDSCSPVLDAGDQWVAANITDDCAVTANFVINTFTVTAETGVGEGTISPATQTIDFGSAATFTVTPETGWSVDSVVGDSCTPVLDAGDQWVAANITDDCAVTANFVINTFTVSAETGAGEGTINPATQTIDFGSAATFTVTPETGWSVDSVVGDSCSPVLDAGDQWVAENITDDCAVTANFVINSYTLAGSVSGLEGQGLVLSLNDEELLPISDDGAFTFASELDFGTAWTVAVDSQPSNPVQTCVVSNGQSDGIEDDVDNIEVNCSTDSFAIGGIVNGLTVDGLELDLNNDQILAITAGATSFEFVDPLPDLSSYVVTVAIQPPGQWCEINNGEGELAGEPIDTVVADCADVAIAFSLSAIDFGFVTIGSPESRTLVISNPNNAPLIIDEISAPSSPFALTANSCSPLPITLQAGESCELTIQYESPEQGEDTDQIIITSNAENSPHVIPVRGTSLVAIPVPTLSVAALILLMLMTLLIAQRALASRRAG